MKNFINLYQKDWLEIVFADRNKEYGAYTLRKNNNRNHLTAFIFIGVFAFVIGFSYTIYRHFKPAYTHPLIHKNVEKILTIDLDRFPVAEPLEVKKEPLKPQNTRSNAAASSQNVVKQNRFVSPKVVSKPGNHSIPTLQELRTSLISNTNIEGIETVGNTRKSKNGNESIGNKENNTVYDSQNIFNEVEVYPEFLGGKEAWSHFLSQALEYPEDAKKTNISGKVVVQFVIETNGQLTDIKVVKSLHKSLDEAAVFALKKSPRWRPGFQNGLPVRVRFSIPIHFDLR